MAESAPALYEGLFLMSVSAGADLNAALEQVREILNRAGAEILVLHRWDERKLAFPIRGQKRGVYLLAYFNAPRNRVIGIERDCNLSEHVVRAMVLRADHIGETELELAKKEAAERSVERSLHSDSNDDSDQSEQVGAAIGEDAE